MQKDSEVEALPRVTLVTGNKGKLAEVQAILAGSAILDAHKIDLPELQGTPEEITREKARTAYNILKVPCVIEDTSLCFNCLGGLPGAYIKWFMESVGNEGLIKMVSSFEDKTAYAQCIFALCEGPEEKDIHVFIGRCNGTLVKPDGTSGFGWDPIFKPDEGDGKTFAGMTAEDKNKISHRAKGLAALKAFYAERMQGDKLEEKRVRKE